MRKLKASAVIRGSLCAAVLAGALGHAADVDVAQGRSRSANAHMIGEPLLFAVQSKGAEGDAYELVFRLTKDPYGLLPREKGLTDIDISKTRGQVFIGGDNLSAEAVGFNRLRQARRKDCYRLSVLNSTLAQANLGIESATPGSRVPVVVRPLVPGGKRRFGPPLRRDAVLRKSHGPRDIRNRDIQRRLASIGCENVR